MSLDGYIAGPGVSPDQPMGEGGEALHEWMFADDPGPDNAAAREEMVAMTGAVILGRRTFELGLPHWNGTPFPAPSFVLTHRPPPVDFPDGFVFVQQGVDAALQQAQAAAGGRGVRLMGADVTRQFLAAGHVDEILVKLVPMLLGGGERPFPDSQGRRLRQTACVATPLATHLRFSVQR